MRCETAMCVVRVVQPSQGVDKSSQQHRTRSSNTGIRLPTLPTLPIIATLARMQKSHARLTLLKCEKAT